MTTHALKTAFELGKLVATPGAIETLGLPAITEAIHRHTECDWDHLPDEDKRANTLALSEGGRIFSAFRLDGTNVWVITESDRSFTTVLLPHEY